MNPEHLSKKELATVLAESTGADEGDFIKKTRKELEGLYKVIDTTKPNQNMNMFSPEALEKLFNTAPSPAPMVMHPETYKKLQDIEPKKTDPPLGGMKIQESSMVPPGQAYVLGNDNFDLRGDLVARAGKAMAQKLEKSIFDGITASQDGYATRQPTLEELINKSPNEHVVKMLMKKMGRWIKDKDMKDVTDYLIRKSRSLHAEKSPITADPDSMEHLKQQLEQLPGVKVNIMFDDYPESASIIIKVNSSALDDSEAEQMPNRIHDVITLAKPKGLDELEVIFHHKEVY